MNDRIRTSTWVATTVDDAFSVFTSEIDRWWKRGPVPGGSELTSGVLRFEPGRLVRVVSSPVGERIEEVGEVWEWSPGEKLRFAWPVESPSGERLETEVEIVFEPENDGCRVVLEHRGWEKLAPPRVGMYRQAYRDSVALRWSSVLVDFRYHREQMRRGDAV